MGEPPRPGVGLPAGLGASAPGGPLSCRGASGVPETPDPVCTLAPACLNSRPRRASSPNAGPVHRAGGRGGRRGRRRHLQQLQGHHRPVDEPPGPNEGADRARGGGRQFLQRRDPGAGPPQKPGRHRFSTGGNLGYPAGINAATQRAGDAATMLVLNPDLTVEAGSLKTMLHRLRASRAGAVVPRLLGPGGTTAPHCTASQASSGPSEMPCSAGERPPPGMVGDDGFPPGELCPRASRRLGHGVGPDGPAVAGGRAGVGRVVFPVLGGNRLLPSPAFDRGNGLVRAGGRHDAPRRRLGFVGAAERADGCQPHPIYSPIPLRRIRPMRFMPPSYCPRPSGAGRRTAREYCGPLVWEGLLGRTCRGRARTRSRRGLPLRRGDHPGA